MPSRNTKTSGLFRATSEELLQTVPAKLGRHLYYRLGETTVAQLVKSKIIGAGRISKDISQKKPDGLIVLPGGTVKAVVEYKPATELRTSGSRKKHAAQEMGVAQKLCKVLILTDGTRAWWFNSLTGNEIKAGDQNPVRQAVDAAAIADETLPDETAIEIERLLDLAAHSLSDKNDVLSKPIILDPSPLAKSVWQLIWVNTGKEPEKCLYNVVELFVFKFLSDIGVLQAHNNFASIVRIRNEAGDAASLRQYADRCRKDVRDLFPQGEDGTTIINGTIFVNERGEPNVSQAQLFGEVVQQLEDYDEQYGSFRYIDREFKTRLYESFLRQGAGVKSLGQFFTPRNVVQAMVKMSDASSLRTGSRVCDPFCGVGGFVLETIVSNNTIYKEFEPKDGAVQPGITVRGYDKGTDEKDDERTIILAKANMLIYFSDLLAKYHTQDHLKEFASGAFNSVFHLIRSNLGTFAKFDDDPFDLILTNPPYVTSGSASIKRAIDNQGLNDRYKISGRGTEALALEWIIDRLTPGGQAGVIVPDGLLLQSGVLQSLAEQAEIEAIVSLPKRTFYSTPRKTYIVFLRRKVETAPQKDPVFLYLTSEIGETRDVYRFPIKQNDLAEAAILFRQFVADKQAFSSKSDRCKVLSFESLAERRNWLIEREWSAVERSAFEGRHGVDEITGEDFSGLLDEIGAVVREGRSHINRAVKISEAQPDKRMGTISLVPPYIRFVTTQTKWAKKVWIDLQTGNDRDIPLYTAAAGPVAHVDEDAVGNKLIIASEENPVISFGANGDASAGSNLVFHTRPFAVGADRTCFRVTAEDVLPKYVFHRLHNLQSDYGFNHTYKATPSNVAQVEISVPINSHGAFDVAVQETYVLTVDKVRRTRQELMQQLQILEEADLRLD
ncbi:MAG: N-6 DNA methylase [Planctomycetota bacterium]